MELGIPIKDSSPNQALYKKGSTVRKKENNQYQQSRSLIARVLLHNQMKPMTRQKSAMAPSGALKMIMTRAGPWNHDKNN